MKNKALILKFGIGLIAGLCAAIFPRLIAVLTATNDGDVLELFSRNFILLSLLFATLIGAVTAIFEWGKTRVPKDIFMSALAIPGILSGAVNTAVSVNDYEGAVKEKTAYENIIQQDFNIQELAPTKLTPLSKLGPSLPGASPANISLISTAHAGNLVIAQGTKYGLGIGKPSQSYFVVLDQAATEEEAQGKADRLRNTLPVEIYRNENSQYYITTTSGQQSKSGALQEAVTLQRQHKLNSSLVEIQ